MTQPGWTLEDIDWSAFRKAAVDADLLAVVKSAALVEINSGDYVAYLRNVFGSDPPLMAEIERWGREEEQHGRALGRWAEMADPEFSLERAWERFRARFRLRIDVNQSIRGSQSGELLARCVVESGTSSFYTAIRDATDEPVLRSIAGHIAADEFRHYKLFYENLRPRVEAERPSLAERIWVATSRVRETEDDELASAYYAANVPQHEPYNAKRHARAYERLAMRVYQRHHIERGVSMIGKAVGFDPHGLPVRMVTSAFWNFLRLRNMQLHQAA